MLADRLRIQSIEYARAGIEMRFGADPLISPERLVQEAARRPGTRLTPSGTLRLDLDSGPGTAGADRVARVRDLLLSLMPCDSIPPDSQPSVVGPANGA